MCGYIIVGLELGSWLLCVEPTLAAHKDSLA